MADDRPISFLALLAELQAVLGQSIRVEMSRAGLLFGISFDARLERVETLSARSGAVVLHFDDKQMIALDPSETNAEVSVSAGEIHLELRIECGLLLGLTLGETAGR